MFSQNGNAPNASHHTSPQTTPHMLRHKGNDIGEIESKASTHSSRQAKITAENTVRLRLPAEYALAQLARRVA
jgi:hypothetical protein